MFSRDAGADQLTDKSGENLGFVDPFHDARQWMARC